MSGIVAGCALIENDEEALLEVLENLQRAVLGKKEQGGEFFYGARFGTAVPEDQQRLNVRNAVDLIENETVDFDAARILFVS
jgi:hypothetical protein